MGYSKCQSPLNLEFVPHSNQRQVNVLEFLAIAAALAADPTEFFCERLREFGRRPRSASTPDS